MLTIDLEHRAPGKFLAQGREGFRMPGRVHNAEILALQGQRQAREEIRKGLALRRGRLLAGEKLALGPVVVGGEEPAIGRFGCTAQEVEFVIAQNALGTARRHQVDDIANHAGAVRAPIAQVTDEDHAALVRVPTVRPVAEPVEEGMQGLELAVHIADDIERAGQQGARNRG